MAQLRQRKAAKSVAGAGAGAAADAPVQPASSGGQKDNGKEAAAVAGDKSARVDDDDDDDEQDDDGNNGKIKTKPAKVEAAAARAPGPPFGLAIRQDRNGHYKAGMPSKTFVEKYGAALAPLILTAIALLMLTGLDSGVPIKYGICSREGRIYVSSTRTTECLVVHRDQIEFKGTLEETRTRYGDKDTFGSIAVWPGKVSKKAGLKIFYLRPNFVAYPGLTDAHGHIMGFGHSLSIANVVASRSKEDVIRMLIAYLNRLPRLERATQSRILEAHGFDQTKWPGAQWPTAADLDVGALRGKKIFITRIDIHACWISPALLDTLDVPDEIPGGIIMRDGEGKPTGVFLDTAFEWVQSQLPQWSTEDRLKYYKAAMDKLTLSGITGVHDAAMTLENIEFLKKLDSKRLLPIRIYGMVACPKLDEFCGDKVERYDGHHLVIRSAKLFLDGALGSFGAAMLEPYSDNPSEMGIARMSKDTLRHLVQSWTENGFQVNTHAIGDAANRWAIDVYEEILQQTGKSNKELRHRIEHAQIIAPEDIARAGRLGLIGSVQPTHATSDMGYAESRLGPERIKGAYAWQSLLQAGSPLALGSDFPVERPPIVEGFHAAVSRLNSTNDSPHGPGGWYPSERLTRQQALDGFTTGAAYARFSEHELGTLEVGKKADITVLDRDIMTAPVDKLRTTWARITIVGGRVVYGKLK